MAASWIFDTMIWALAALGLIFAGRQFHSSCLMMAGCGCRCRVLIFLCPVH